jgi:hypothetical protein
MSSNVSEQNAIGQYQAGKGPSLATMRLVRTATQSRGSLNVKQALLSYYTLPLLTYKHLYQLFVETFYFTALMVYIYPKGKKD